MLLFTIELLPTCVKNSATSLVRRASVFGGVFGPMPVAAERWNFILCGVWVGDRVLWAVCIMLARDKE